MRGGSSQARDLRVGRYVVHGEIATGGMATVHYGRLVGPAGFSRSVAIKRLHPQFSKNPDFVSMFLDEARLASRILHPNVVPILDVVAESGELFLVMEFVPGEALVKLMQRTPEGIPLSMALALAVGMLEGLHAAHEARGDAGEPLAIVHRDVSPQNVLVGLDGVARLIDFGIAKAAGNSTLTREGHIKGKVGYMAPEQLRAQPVDRRADIYAASVVLWEMLTGARFLGKADSEAAQVLLAIEAKTGPPSSVRPELPTEVDEVVMRGLAPLPEHRFSTAREMAQMLEKIGRPAAARDVARWVEAKAGEALRRHSQHVNDFDLSVATELPGRPSAQALHPADPQRAGEARAANSTAERGAHDDEVTRTRAMRRADRGRTRGVWIATAIVAAAAFGFYTARFMARAEAPETQPAPIELAPSEPTAEVAPPSPQQSESPPAEPSSAAVASSSAPQPDVTARSTSTATPPRPRAAAAPRPRASTTPRTNCNPPYVITADGMRQFKPECVR
jgi:serine/threonine-protein kinase